MTLKSVFIGRASLVSRTVVPQFIHSKFAFGQLPEEFAMFQEFRFLLESFGQVKNFSASKTFIN